jgi:hypothetical protein
MTITTEEAELQRHQIEEVRLLSLAAERDALREKYKTESRSFLRTRFEFEKMQRRIARQRRALAKLYQRRHDRKAERDHLEKTAMQAAQCHGRETLRADKLQAENARLREAIEMARECLEDKDVIGAKQTLTLALGETQ